jgi:acyl-CoA reductase-like NAD-dependent aldehyde dehydrogenase
LSAIADVVDAHADELARLLTLESGKPLPLAMAEVGALAAFTRYFSTLALETKTLEAGEGRRADIQRRPLGVVGAIIPWNFPLMIVGFKLPPALLAGNTVVLKPAPTTPLATLRLAELIAPLVPAGVVNVITDQNDLGDALTSHPDVAKISFTGSAGTGRKIMNSASASLKRLTLELGGNDAAIVLGDVDVKGVAPKLFEAAFVNSGQVCLAIKRLYVHESIYDQMCAELASLAEASIVGDGLQQGVTIGPLQNKTQFSRVLSLIDDASQTGQIIAGGARADGKGYFIRPTIVRDIKEGARLVDEEQFGPVLPVIKFSTADEAIARANASPFGLGGSIWSSDEEGAYALASKLEAGTVWINTHMAMTPNVPFGGSKQSGFGVEFGEEGLAEFTQITIVNRAA